MVVDQIKKKLVTCIMSHYEESFSELLPFAVQEKIENFFNKIEFLRS